MVSRCFFGHRDTPEELKIKIEEVIINLIENNNIKLFYVGNNGQFDYMVENILKKLKKKYPQINYYVVLAYIPTHNKEFDLNDYSNTVYPDGLEKSPLKFAISKRNEWVLNKSTYVITYAKYRGNNAYKLYLRALSKGKFVINLAESFKPKK